jgi:hypothetical protein
MKLKIHSLKLSWQHYSKTVSSYQLYWMVNSKEINILRTEMVFKHWFVCFLHSSHCWWPESVLQKTKILFILTIIESVHQGVKKGVLIICSFTSTMMLFLCIHGLMSNELLRT